MEKPNDRKSGDDEPSDGKEEEIRKSAIADSTGSRADKIRRDVEEGRD